MRTPSTTATTDAPTDTAPAEPLPTTALTTPADEGELLEDTIVRFNSGDTHVDVTIMQDNPTARDFLSMLPLTLILEEFSGREKIGYPPRPLETTGSPGHDPEDGDLIYFTPWGNIGFYYNAEGIGYDDRVIHLGTFDAMLDQLNALEGRDVTIEVVR